MGRALSIIFLISVVVASALPLAWMFATAAKSSSEIRESAWRPPTAPTLDNIQRVWRHRGFVRSGVNSVLVTTVAGLGLLLLGALAGYGFARFDFGARRLLWALLLGGLFLPVHVALIPLYRLQAVLGLGRGYGALLFLAVVYIAFNLSFTVFYLRGFFAAVPRELVDAACVDGCGPTTTLWRIMLPLSLPALTVVALVNFVMVWNEFVFALVLLPSADTSTLPIAVKAFSDETGLDLGLTCAALALTVLPVIVLFAGAQRHIVQGMTAGAVKG